MAENQFYELDKLIREYDEDNRTIRSERYIMKVYPKLLVLSVASLFEVQIKNYCNEFINHPINSLSIDYPQINSMFHNRKPVVDQMFAKLEAYKDASEHLDAEPFYNLFGGQAFKSTISSFFASEKEERLISVHSRIDSLNALVEESIQYEFDYAKQTDLADQLESSSFASAEYAYLSLKLRRNCVAHDYINGMSDSFEDIQKLYNIATLYVISLEKAIQSITAISEG